MALLEIKAIKKVSVHCSLEESTAILVDQYAAFIQRPAVDVINAVLEHVFSKDREFQQFLKQSNSIEIPDELRMQRLMNGNGGAKRGPKPRIAVGN